MSRPKVNIHLNTFIKRIDEATRLINEMREYKIIRNGKIRQIKSISAYKIIEMAFLEMFLSWEEFLEFSFIKYMCGAHTSKGYHPKRFIYPANIEHAQKFFILNGKRYSDWSNPQDIIQRANIIFTDGEPFVPAIRPSITDLEDIRTIRNAIAHQSGTAWQLFLNVTRQHLGAIPKGISPGMFLQRNNPKENITFFEYYRKILETASSLIVR